MSIAVFHISSDAVFLFDTSGSLRIPYSDLERTLPKEFVKYARKTDLQHIYVITGPGSFTMLRIGTLCVNLLHNFSTQPLHVFSLSKFELYEHCRSTGQLPGCGFMFSGQRKKMWKVQKKSEKGIWEKVYVTVSDTGMMNGLSEYRVDFVEEHPVVMMLESRFVCQHMRLENQTLVFDRNEKSISVPLSVWNRQQTPLVPEYMMDPLLH